MGASGNVVPCIIRLSSFGSDNKPVVFEEALTLESLRDWASGVKSGKYKYTPKSEPIPEENNGPVKVRRRRIVAIAHVCNSNRWWLARTGTTL